MADVPHTLSIFDDDLDQLRAMVSEMGGRVEESIRDAVIALARGDQERARRVIVGDGKVDELAAAIERHALRLIALRMPLADDLRDVLAALKIAMIVARMGDCAKNIAHRSNEIEACRSIDPVKLIQAMASEVSSMVKSALDAYVHRSAAAALQVGGHDDVVDDLYTCATRDLIAHIQVDPDDTAEAVNLLFAAQKLERIGDHAADIAGIVHFAATGQPMPAESALDPVLESAA